MNLVLSTLLLAYFLAFAAYCCWDVHEECEFQMAAAEHEELLDALWSDDA